MNKLKLLFLRPFNDKSKNQLFKALGNYYEIIYNLLRVYGRIMQGLYQILISFVRLWIR